jgi:DNA adenine methylase
MILRRLGNKKNIARDIQAYFPPHKMYIEPFFGAGGMFFNKPKSEHSILNDIDSEVINLFLVITEDYKNFIDFIETTPYSSDLLEYWKTHKEVNKIKKAARFCFISNLTFLGAGASLRYDNRNHKRNLISGIETTSDFLKDTSFKFNNKDFRKFIKGISLSEERTVNSAFIYADPPYLDTGDNYSDSFTEDDSNDLFDCLEESKCKFAMSEFDHPFILEQAEKRGLNIIYIGERQNLKNRRTEVLITNYVNNQTSLF